MKRIIGMIHLAGRDQKEIIDRAIEEIDLYQSKKLNGAILENYHGEISDVVAVIAEIYRVPRAITVGINILPNNYESALEWAEVAEPFKNGFIQLDHVAGKYVEGNGINKEDYLTKRLKHPDIKVYGGVWPKYYTPVKGSNLENDLLEGMTMCDAIVVTGNGTGMETPIGKIRYFRQIIGNKELIIGAGLNKHNAREQLAIADGAIIGSYFKNGKTEGTLDINRIDEIMAIAKEFK